MSLCVFLWFQVISGWNWGTWAKLWKRLTKGLLMLLESDLPALEMDFLELQNSKWRALNGVGKYTSRTFQKYIIVHTLFGNWRRKLVLNVSSMLLSGVKLQKHVTTRSWMPKTRYNLAFNPKRSLCTCKAQAQSKHTPKWALEVNFCTKTYFCKS